MFYVKERLNDSMEISIEITDENVFCHCPMCGAEVMVDIGEILGDGESDLFGTAIYCNECSKKIRDGGGYDEHK
ncbi:hypothetical protein EV215_0929 [Hypnocyclicus thermotrophus]|uniref:Uncharacterized protein n=1 Tax=Hypnocyclicus thermotrophus TaxID=1627895 RepID=A0AA46I621_9FUSO|nr:hypothetical protein [Hypnocyclicus thermotrophus]TDT71551.1 hypothetical protein EV215_0929 [Hypnocyclicus thermotrophus]